MEGSQHTLDALGIAWRLGATLFFVFLNAFFVAAEFALVKVRSARIDTLAREGGGAAQVLQHILAHLDRYLSACQLGVTMASLVLGALGEPAVSVLLVAAAEGVGLDVARDSSWVPVASIALAFTVITALHMTIGEQAPKMWALRRAERTALGTAYVLRGFAWVFRPVIAVLNAGSNGILGLLGLPPELGHEGAPSTEEIRSILSLSARSGTISEREYEITENVFRLIELEVRHIVVPRVDVVFLSLEHTTEQCLERVRLSGHSRLPLCEVGLDTIVGFVHTKDVLDHILAGREIDLAKIAREPLFVPDTMAVSDFLLELQRTHVHCAAVVDERGTVIGLAFREDALEEIVGPLGDEFDVIERELRELEGGAYDISGAMSMPEVCDRLDFMLSDDEYEDVDTIGGHVTARLGRMPKRGDRVMVGPYMATVTEIARRRVQRVRMQPTPRKEPDAEDAES